MLFEVVCVHDLKFGSGGTTSRTFAVVMYGFQPEREPKVTVNPFLPEGEVTPHMGEETNKRNDSIPFLVQWLYEERLRQLAFNPKY